MEPAKAFLKKYLGYLVLFVTLIVVYQWIASPMVVTVAGTGEVSAPAETATLTFTLSSNGEIPQFAADKIKATTNKIKESLTAGGIPNSDIYEASTVILPAATITAGATGYQATLNMGIKTAKVSNLDSLTASLYTLGASVVTQPILSIGNKEKLESQAYDLALADAKKQANTVASKHWKFMKKTVLGQDSTPTTASTVTRKAESFAQIRLINISKTLSVSYKMW